MLSESILIDPSHNVDIEKCLKCRKFVYYSQVQRIYFDNEPIPLKCGVCQEEVDYSTKDASQLTLQRGCPSLAQPITNIEDVSPGDLISYLKIVTILRHRHYAIVTEVDNVNDILTVVEFVPHFPLRWGRVNQERVEMESVVENGAWIFRFMPLDCLPTSGVLENAKIFLEKDKSTWPLKFSMKCSAQHFASWCKTGETSDLNQIFPKSWYKEMENRLELVKEYPATFYIDISDEYTKKLDSRVMDKCPCGAEFCRSSIIDANEAAVELKCNACKSHNLLPNVASQKTKLMNGFNKFRKERVKSIRNLASWDILIFRRLFYEHHGIVTDETTEDSPKITEYSKEKTRGDLKKVYIRTRSFVRQELMKNIMYVKRFLPLDCLAPRQVERRVKRYAEHQPQYHLLTNNCQIMASDCKTGCK